MTKTKNKEKMLSELNCEELCFLSNKKEKGKAKNDAVKKMAEEEMAEKVCGMCE